MHYVQKWEIFPQLNFSSASSGSFGISFSSYGVKNLEALNDDGVDDVDSMTTYYSQYAHTIYTKCYFALAKKPPFAYE